MKIWSGLGVSVKSYGGFVEKVGAVFPILSHINWKYKQMIITNSFSKANKFIFGHKLDIITRNIL